MNLYESYISGSLTVSGSINVSSNLIVTGAITAQQYIISSSVTYLTESFASGSHKFGDTIDDTHQFTGSVSISGSLQIPSASSNPTGASAGQIYFNTTDTNIYRYDGSFWLKAAGTSGTSGSSGSAGTSGSSGSAGTSGTSGSSGSTGTSGTSGSSGSSGSSGTSITTSGANNTLTKFTSTTTVGNATNLTDDGTTFRIGENTVVTGSLVVTGNLTAQQFIVSSSVTYLTESFASGSHVFGNSIDDTHQFTGSVLITGSSTIIGPISASIFTGSFTGSLLGTATTASFVTLAQTASFINPLTQSVNINGNTLITGSLGINTAPSSLYGLSIKRTAGSNGALYLIGNDNIVGNVGVNFYNDNTTSGSYITMYANGGLNLNGVMAVTGSAVGINTAATNLQANGVGLNISSNTTQFPVMRLERVTGGAGSKTLTNWEWVVGSTGQLVLQHNTDTTEPITIEYGAGSNALYFKSGSSVSVGINKAGANTTLDVNGNTTITGSLVVSSTITSSGSAVRTDTTTNYSTTFTSVSSVSVTHNLGTKNVHVMCYDSTDAMFWPATIVTTSTTVVDITFTTARTGRVVIIR